MSRWEEQWNRVLRWHERFGRTNTSRTPNEPSSDYYQGEVYAFFQSCYHFKDWLRNGASVPKTVRDKVEDFAFGPKDHRERGNTPLQICADLANGSKHVVLNSSKVDSATRIERRDFALSLSAGNGEVPALAVKYEVHAGKKVYDAYALATDSVEAWTGFLRVHGLTTS